MPQIPAIVEDVPVVCLHADMGPHNVVVAVHPPDTNSAAADAAAAAAEAPVLRAVIDWEFVASAPFAASHRLIKMLLRRKAANGFGALYLRADELRSAFWGAIPEWRRWHEGPATAVFLEWFRFALFMKAD
jgi:hypothetical protein